MASNALDTAGQPQQMPDRGLLICLPDGGGARLSRAGLDRCGWAGASSGAALAQLIRERVIGVVDLPNHNPTLALRLSPDEAAVMASPYAMLASAELKPVLLQPEVWGRA